jgi:hypothetical protein
LSEAALEFESNSLTQKPALGAPNIDFIFKFENTGAAPVSITQVYSGCGCTVPHWPKAPIAPGASGQLPVSYHPAGKQGRQTQKIQVHTSDQKIHELVIEVDLPVRVTISPRLLLLKGSQHEARKGLVTFSDDTPVTLLGVTVDNPRFEFLEPPELEGDTLGIVVCHAGDAATSARGVIRVRSRTRSGREYADLIYVRYTP